MHIVEQLLNTAHQDNDQLRILQAKDKNPQTLHTLDYCLKTKHQKQAEIVCSFVNDNGYGDAAIEANGDLFDIVVEIQTPLIDSVVCGLSANMVHVAHTFSVEYIGWQVR